MSIDYQRQHLLTQTMLFGLISRWMMSLSCMNTIPDTTCGQEGGGDWLIKTNRLLPKLGNYKKWIDLGKCLENWGAGVFAIKGIKVQEELQSITCHKSVLDCHLWEFANVSCFFCPWWALEQPTFLPVEKTSCTCPQWACTPCSWSSQTAPLPSDGKICLLVLQNFCHHLKVLSEDDTLQARLKVLLQVKDGSALFHLHLDDLNWSLLWGVTLFKISSSFLA